MTIKVTHRGATSGDPVELKDAVVRVEFSSVMVSFPAPRGFGNSEFNLCFRPESYEVVARAMMHANPEAAVKAFGTALQAGIPEPKDWVSAPALVFSAQPKA